MQQGGACRGDERVWVRLSISREACACMWVATSWSIQTATGVILVLDSPILHGLGMFVPYTSISESMSSLLRDPTSSYYHVSSMQVISTCYQGDSVRQAVTYACSCLSKAWLSRREKVSKGKSTGNDSNRMLDSSCDSRVCEDLPHRPLLCVAEWRSYDKQPPKIAICHYMA